MDFLSRFFESEAPIALGLEKKAPYSVTAFCPSCRKFIDASVIHQCDLDMLPWGGLVGKKGRIGKAVLASEL
jgi:hypothetical protein